MCAVVWYCGVGVVCWLLCIVSCSLLFVVCCLLCGVVCASLFVSVCCLLSAVCCFWLKCVV